MTNTLTVYEVGARDGLQNEAVTLSTENKKRLIDGLIKAGLRHLEVSSFVHPKAVPQMADADELMADTLHRHRDDRLEFTGLVFNEKGYERLVSTGCRSVAIGAAVSDSFSRANTGMSPVQALAMTDKLIRWARRDGIRVRVYISTAWVCPFDGPVLADRTIAYAEKIWEMGVDELAIADTVGHANPLQVGRLMEELGKRLEMEKLAVHLHDTQALGLANTTAAIQAGVRIHDASVGGLGGCPYAPGAAGNLATEDLVFLAYKMDFGTGIDFPELWKVVYMIEKFVKRPIGGRIRAWWESESRLHEDSLPWPPTP